MTTLCTVYVAVAVAAWVGRLTVLTRGGCIDGSVCPIVLYSQLFLVYSSLFSVPYIIVNFNSVNSFDFVIKVPF